MPNRTAENILLTELWNTISYDDDNDFDWLIKQPKWNKEELIYRFQDWVSLYANDEYDRDYFPIVSTTNIFKQLDFDYIADRLNDEITNKIIYELFDYEIKYPTPIFI